MRLRAAKAGALALVLLVAAAAIATAAVVQQGNLRITVLGQIEPFRLPRTGTAPIAVFIAGHIGTADGSVPPQLEKMTIKINRHGRLDSTGLPVCSLPQIQPGSTSRALADCPGSLIGSGRFWASIILPDQRPYPTRGRLLVFNGRENGRPVIFAHIYTTNPFDTSFVVTFAIHHLAHGKYGTELSASLPQSLGSWGYVDRIKLTLRRDYTYRGQRRSYFNAGCPAPKGLRSVVFPLALANFSFAGGKQVSLTVTRPCRVRE